MYFNNDTLGLVLTESGIILKTRDRGVTWEAVSALSVNDAVSMAVTGDRYYALTRSGDLYMGYSPSDLSLLSSTGSVDMVDLKGYGRTLFALSKNGDTYIGYDRGRNWVFVGNTGSQDMKAIISLPDTLWAMNATGYLFVSQDSGRVWSLVSTVSQVGVVDMTMDKNHNIYALLDAGDVAKKPSYGNWWFTGTTSQMGAMAIETPYDPTLPDSERVHMHQFFTVSPTFTSRFMKVSVEHEFVGRYIHIYNVTGKEIGKLPILNAETILDLGKYHSGMYFIRIGAEIEKIIKR